MKSNKRKDGSIMIERRKILCEEGLGRGGINWKKT
jgi:hypothetical protein